MSRYKKKLNDMVLVYGTDHALGFFYEEWTNEAFEHKDGVPLTDRCQLFGMMPSQMIKVLAEYRCPTSHIEAVQTNTQF
jgi:hypothetical protein